MYISLLISKIIHETAELADKQAWADNRSAQWMAVIVFQSEWEKVKGIPVWTCTESFIIHRQ